MTNDKQPETDTAQRDYIRVLKRLVDKTAREHRVEVLLNQALSCLIDDAPGYGAVAFLCDDLDQELSLSSVVGIDIPPVGEVDSTFGSEILSAIETTFQSGKVNRVGNDQISLFPTLFSRFGSFICAHLKVEDRNLGVLGLFFPEGFVPNDNDIDFIILASDLIAQKVDIARTAAVQLAIEKELIRNESYLECLSDISSSLLEAPDPTKAIPSIVEWLRHETSACRCHYFSISIDDNGDRYCHIKTESVADGIQRQNTDPRYQNIHMVNAGLGRWIELLESGNELKGYTASLPEKSSRLLAKSGTKWILVVPVTVLGSWVGTIGFDVTEPDTEMGDQEVALLRSAANALSAALGKRKILEELENAHNHLENILQATSIHAIIATDHAFNIIHFSHIAESLFGYTREEAVGRNLIQTKMFEGTELDGLQIVRDTVYYGENWDGDIDIVDPNGQLLTLNTLVSGMYTRNNEHYGYTFFIRDVTEHRLQERQLVEHQRMESVGMLAGGIAHDFNNILMGILGYASLAKDRIEDDHPANRMVGIIEKSAERAASLTRELLAYARGGKSQSVNVQLNDQIDEILSILATNIPKGVVVEKYFADKLPWLLVDPAQLQQVIMNLCLNAGDAVSERIALDGGENIHGVISITTHEKCISPEEAEKLEIENFRNGTRFVCMEVTDNGTGMDDETMRRIFEPFFTTKITGRGLGLAAVEGIIRNHDGCLLVKSRLGEGSTFTVMLPEDLDCVIEDCDDELIQFGGSETILVIDDEDVNRQLALLTLTNVGHTVLLAENSRQGLDVLKKHQASIDLILLDLTMPGMSIEVMLNELDNLDSAIPIVLTSGFDEGKLREIKGTQNAAAFLQKPYTPDVLARAVRKVLDIEIEKGEGK